METETNQGLEAVAYVWFVCANGALRLREGSLVRSSISHGLDKGLSSDTPSRKHAGIPAGTNKEETVVAVELSRSTIFWSLANLKRRASLPLSLFLYAYIIFLSSF